MIHGRKGHWEGSSTDGSAAVAHEGHLGPFECQKCAARRTGQRTLPGCCPPGDTLLCATVQKKYPRRRRLAIREVRAHFRASAPLVGGGTDGCKALEGKDLCGMWRRGYAGCARLVARQFRLLRMSEPQRSCSSAAPPNPAPARRRSLPSLASSVCPPSRAAFPLSIPRFLDASRMLA
jgi:hypothetical protein